MDSLKYTPIPGFIIYGKKIPLCSVLVWCDGSEGKCAHIGTFVFRVIRNVLGICLPPNVVFWILKNPWQWNQEDCDINVPLHVIFELYMLDHVCIYTAKKSNSFNRFLLSNDVTIKYWNVIIHSLCSCCLTSPVIWGFLPTVLISTKKLPLCLISTTNIIAAGTNDFQSKW